MSRSALVGNVTAMLEDAGFLVSERCAVRPKSFDVAARRDDSLLLVKILGNIDAFDGRTGIEMRRLGGFLDATPMVIGLRTRDEELKPGVMYLRHGVPVLSPDTALDLFVEDVPPMIYAAPGGLYVNIDGKVLADEREERDWSLGRLATELGVSRRTVSKYEDGMNASVEVAARMEDLLDAPLANPVDVFESPEALADDDESESDSAEDSLVAVLTRVGFDVHPTTRAPFTTVSEDDGTAENVLTGNSAFTPTAEKRARIMSSLGTVTRTRSVYVVDKSKRDAVEGTALIEREEIDAIRDPDDLRDLIQERAEEPA
ncbi:transcriptional regulator [Halococcus salsus]|uniref:transcriptional regulator n=1 Tax=Halococcus salsus TaxID=2162894 RepID=UPI00135B06CC|nr:transcriptional regulator [Halococcus salsus]